MNHIIILNSTYFFAFKAAQSHTTSSSLPWLPQTEQEHHSFTSHLTPSCLQLHALCLQGFAWSCWAFRRADAAVWVTASARNELLHIGCSMETAHGCAWILCNTLWGRLHATERIYLLHIYLITQLPGCAWGSICYVISRMKFRRFRPPGSRKKVGALTCLPFGLVLFQSLKQGSFMRTTC